jgi:sec-independent protein translocase protein TatA
VIGGLGAPELVMIFLVALAVFGPSKIPEFGKSLGKAIRSSKNTLNEAEKLPADNLAA